MSRKFKEDIISEYQIKTSVCEHLVLMFKWATNSSPDQFKVQIVNFFDKFEGNSAVLNPTNLKYHDLLASIKAFLTDFLVFKN